MSWFEQLRREVLLAARARASHNDDGNGGGGGDLDNKWARDALFSSSSPVNDVHVFATDRQVISDMPTLTVFVVDPRLKTNFLPSYQHS